MNTETIKEIDVQSVMTKSALPVGGSWDALTPASIATHRL